MKLTEFNEFFINRPTGGVVRGKYPQPLSVSVLPATSTIQYSGSAFFRTVMEQSRATHLIVRY